MAYPWFQFHYADWHAPALRMVSLATRGFYVGCVCIMEQSDPPGFLKIFENFLPKNDLAQVLGCSKKEASECLDELLKFGVFECTEDGGIYSPTIIERHRLNKQNSERQARFRSKGANGPAHEDDPVTRNVTPSRDASRDALHDTSRDALHNALHNGETQTQKKTPPPLDPLRGGPVSPPVASNGLEAGLETALPGARGGIPCPMPARFPFASDRAWAKRFWTKHDRPDLADAIDVEVVKFQAHYGKRDAQVANWGEAWRYWVAETMNRTRKANGHNGLSNHDKLELGFAIAQQAFAEDPANETAGIVDVQRNDRPPESPRALLPGHGHGPKKVGDPDG